MQIVVLNDGQTFSDLDGCEIVTVSNDFKWDDVNDADEIPAEFIDSRVVLNKIAPNEFTVSRVVPNTPE